MSILSETQVAALRAALSGRSLALCYGAGLDSTAMIVALHEADIRPAVITFADTRAEKKVTMDHIAKMNAVLVEWGWPEIVICRKVPLASTGYEDLYGNCIKNQTLPSLAFGMKSCSIKWKQVPQDQFLMGRKRGASKTAPHPIWTEYLQTGIKVMKLIGYDAGPADMRRSKNLSTSDQFFDYRYPLQILGWTRRDCVLAISNVLGVDMVPWKSSCFFCPAQKQWELYWLAAHQPELLELALFMERNALTGKHSRFDEVEFGASWEELVNTSDRFPSSKTTVGLGRSFAWNQWARVNEVVDENFVVKRHPIDRERFNALSLLDAEQGADNAFGQRQMSKAKSIIIHSREMSQQ